MRRFVYCAFLLALVPLAAAQEILVGKRSYPLILAVPLLIVAVLWFFIFLSWLYRKKDWFFEHVLHLHKLFTRLRIKKKKVPEVKKKEEPKKDLSPYLEKVENLEARLPRLKVDAAFKEFTTIAKDFFAKLLGLNYEFTDEELVAHAGERKKEIATFAKGISEIKYSPEGISLEKLASLIHELKKIMKPYLQHAKSERKALGFFGKIVEEDKRLFDNIKGYVDYLKTESKKKEIVNLLHEERRVLKDDMGTLRRTYNRILEMYVQLSPEERVQLYPELVEFYNTVNNALFSTVYGEKSKEQLQYFLEQLKKIKEMPRKPSLLRQIKRIFFTKKPVENKKPGIFASVLKPSKHPVERRKLAEKHTSEELPLPPHPSAPVKMHEEKHHLEKKHPAQKHPEAKKPELTREHHKLLRTLQMQASTEKQKQKFEHLRTIQEARKEMIPVKEPEQADKYTAKQKMLLDEEKLLLEKIEGKIIPQRKVHSVMIVKQGIAKCKRFLKDERLKRTEEAYASLQPYLQQLTPKEQKSFSRELRMIAKGIEKLKAQGQQEQVISKRQETLLALEKEEKHLLTELDRVMKSF